MSCVNELVQKAEKSGSTRLKELLHISYCDFTEENDAYTLLAAH